MLDSISSTSQLNVLIAYLAGFVSFFASCILPLVPVYLAYLAGVALQPEKMQRESSSPDLLVLSAAKRRWSLFEASILFAFGFTIAFMIMGWSIGTLSTVLAQWKWIFNILFGGIFVLFGLHLTGLLMLPALSKQWHFNLGDKLHHNRRATAVLTGLAFGIGWSPCIGPILALILYQAAHTGSQVQGLLLLGAFSAGLSTPFILTGLLFESIVPLLKKMSKFSLYLEKISGVILIITGLLILTGQLAWVTQTVTTFLTGHSVTL